jgi:uncharacterized protein
MGDDGLAGLSRFQDIVRTEAELRDALGHPAQRVLDKVVRVVDEHCRRFIAVAPFMVIATIDRHGIPDVSPKGDPAGFVHVLDERTLAIPDRPGNRRLDTFRNILGNPNVGLIFLVPRSRQSLRISGKAMIVRDADLLETMTVNGKTPSHAIVVAVERVLFHCGKSLIRSGLWQPESWPDISEVSTLAQALVAHAKLAESVEDIQTMIDKNYREHLY